MASAAAVALVVAVTGEGIVRDEEGAWRVPRAGDALYPSDVVMSGAHGRIEIVTADHRSLSLLPNESLTLDSEVTGAFKPDANEAAIRAVAGNFAGILSAGALPGAGEEASAGASFAHWLQLAESLGAADGVAWFGAHEAMAAGAPTDASGNRLDLKDLLPGEDRSVDGEAASADGHRYATLQDMSLTGLGGNAEHAALIQALFNQNKPLPDGS